MPVKLSKSAPASVSLMLVLLLAAGGFAQQTPAASDAGATSDASAVSVARLRAHVAYLASDKL